MEENSVQKRSTVNRVPPNSAVKRWSLPEGPVSIQPPVCSVHPGRLLELSTTVGVSQYNSIIEKQHLSETYMTANARKGQLKSGRLLPLNLHSEPQLTSQACLGVISDRYRTSRRHLRSLTAPLYRSGNGHHWNSKWSNLPSSRRTHSALSTSLELQSAGVINRVPVMTTNIRRPPTIEAVSLPLVQPPLTMEGESHNLKIEIKEKSVPLNNEMLASVKSSDQLPSNAELTLYLTNNTVTRTTTRHLKRSATGGKLSHGWSDPQPITPLVGILPPLTESKVTRKPNFIKTSGAETDTDYVNIDIDKLLQESVDNQ